MTLKIACPNAEGQIWLDDVPSYQGLKTASLGVIQASDTAALQNLLRKAQQALQQHNIQFLLTPMDGNTWHKYRAVTQSDETPPFFLEPQTPDFYTAAFIAEGFKPIANYSSAHVQQPAFFNPPAFVERLTRAGIFVRIFDKTNTQAELEKIYQLSLKTFDKNFLYTAINAAEFNALYQPILPYLIPDFVLMAEDKDKLRGFIFAVPNYNQGEKPNELIIKTYASDYPGLGRHLIEKIHASAQAAGFTTIIHALMHDDNISKRSSDKYARTFRRYALYGKAL